MSNKPGDLERRGKEFQKVKAKSFKKSFLTILINKPMKHFYT